MENAFISTFIKSFFPILIKAIPSRISNFVKVLFLKESFQKKLIGRIEEKLLFKQFFNLEVNQLFKDVYFPLNIGRTEVINPIEFTGFVQMGQNLKNETRKVNLETRSINSVLRKAGNRILVLGEVGSGKTMILQNLFLSCVDHSNQNSSANEQGPPGHILYPLFLELRRLNVPGYPHSIGDLIREELFLSEEKASRVIPFLIDSGKFLLLVDGFDELNQENIMPAYYEVEKLLADHPKIKIVVTSRPYSQIEQLKRLEKYYVQDLSRTEILSILERRTSFSSNSLISFFKGYSGEQAWSVLKNPFILTIFSWTVEREKVLPKSRTDLYRLMLKYWFYDPRKFPDSGLALGAISILPETMRLIFREFSLKTILMGLFSAPPSTFSQVLSPIAKKHNLSFSGDELLTHMVQKYPFLKNDQGGYIGFSHRSFQSFFVAEMLEEMGDFTRKKQVYGQIYYKLNSPSFSMLKNLASFLLEVDREDARQNIFIEQVLKFHRRIKKKGFMVPTQEGVFLICNEIFDQLVISQGIGSGIVSVDSCILRVDYSFLFFLAPLSRGTLAAQLKKDELLSLPFLEKLTLDDQYKNFYRFKLQLPGKREDLSKYSAEISLLNRIRMDYYARKVWNILRNNGASFSNDDLIELLSNRVVFSDNALAGFY